MKVYGRRHLEPGLARLRFVGHMCFSFCVSRFQPTTTQPGRRVYEGQIEHGYGHAEEGKRGAASLTPANPVQSIWVSILQGVAKLQRSDSNTNDEMGRRGLELASAT